MGNKLNCSGIILAGGESRRFGSAKALAEFEDKTFIEYSIESLAPFTDEILIVTREELKKPLTKFSSHQVRILTDADRYKGKGPLAGIYTGMLNNKSEYYLVSPCDMPLMNSKMYVKWLEAAQKNNFDCVIPVLNGKIYPLNGVYKITCMADIISCLRSDVYKVLKLLERKKTKYMKVCRDEEPYFKNVNTPNELIGIKEADCPRNV